MKSQKLLTSLLLGIFPLCVFAGWQVSVPQSSVSRDPFFQGKSASTTTVTTKTTTTSSMPTVFTPSPAMRTAATPIYIPYRQRTSKEAYTNRVFPNMYSLGQPAPLYAVSISGSLKENIERIMGRYHWRVIWKAPFDYNFDGRVTGASLPNVIEKLLQPFPLQAVMYMSNRTLAVVPRAQA